MFSYTNQYFNVSTQRSKYCNMLVSRPLYLEKSTVNVLEENLNQQLGFRFKGSRARFPGSTKSFKLII